MTKKQKQRLSEILSNVESYLYNDLDAICDDDYLDQVQDLLNEVQEGLDILSQESE